MNHYRQHALILVVIISACIPTSVATAETTMLSPIKDNTLYEESAGGLSNGAGTRIFAGKTGGQGPGNVRALLAFDVAGSIPAGSTINSAALELTVSIAAAGASNRDVALHRVTQDWGEGASVAGSGQGGGGVASNGDATWLHSFFDTTTWSTPGGDFLGSPSASETLDAGPGNTVVWNSTNALVDDIQQWLDNPSSNFGWIIIGDESINGTAYAFNSRESGSLTPSLVIDFTPVPEPSCIALAMIAATFASIMPGTRNRPRSRRNQ